MSRVVFLANNVEELGGAQRVVHVLAQGLAQRGYEVDVVGMVPHASPHQYFKEPLYRQRTLASAVSPRREARAEAERALRQFMGSGDAGVVVTAQVWAMEHLLEVPHDGWRVIGQYHSSYEAAATGRDLARLLKAYRDVDAVLALTPEDAQRFRDHGVHGVEAMPNPLALWPEQSAGTARAITYLGRLAPEKGPRFLVDAWSRIESSHPSWILRMVGDGPQAQAMRDVALGFGIEHRVTFEAPVIDIAPVLASTGILAMPSLVEGLPLSLAEGMAAGLPVIATDCSAGVRMLVEPNVNGVLVRRGDAAALALALDSMIDDSVRRIRFGQAARQSVEKYRIESVLDLWEKLLVDVRR